MQSRTCILSVFAAVVQRRRWL